MFIYFWDRERQNMSGGRAEREGDTESEAGSKLWAVSTEPDTGLELTNREIMTWAKVGRSTDWATQAPQNKNIFKVEILPNSSQMQSTKHAVCHREPLNKCLLKWWMNSIGKTKLSSHCQYYYIKMDLCLLWEIL